jgi:hypothetical protein
MAELTVLERKVGEVMGLAMAAQRAAVRVSELLADVDGPELVAVLDRMRRDEAETEARCLERAEQFDGKEQAILEKAREVEREATEMMRTYLGDEADALDGFEFLTMSEAGEAGHWSIVEVMARRAHDGQTSTLAAWARPIQERHLEDAMAGSLALAKTEDPNAAV